MSNFQQYTLWTVWSRWGEEDPWSPLHWTTKYTRSDSIACYQADFPNRPGQYRRRRRGGFLKCVRVRIVPEDPSTLPGRTAEGEET